MSLTDTQSALCPPPPCFVEVSPSQFVPVKDTLLTLQHFPDGIGHFELGEDTVPHQEDLEEGSNLEESGTKEFRRLIQVTGTEVVVTVGREARNVVTTMDLVVMEEEEVPVKVTVGEEGEGTKTRDRGIRGYRVYTNNQRKGYRKKQKKTKQRERKRERYGRKWPPFFFFSSSYEFPPRWLRTLFSFLSGPASRLSKFRRSLEDCSVSFSFWEGLRLLFLETRKTKDLTVRKTNRKSVCKQHECMRSDVLNSSRERESQICDVGERSRSELELSLPSFQVNPASVASLLFRNDGRSVLSSSLL